jgi:hypothetical protein
MNECAALKQQLREAIDASKPDGTYDDVTFDRVHDLIKALLPHNPTPRPIDAQAFVQSPWVSHFAQFGPKHTAGKPIRHETSMKLQSFNVFPNLPIKVDELTQEIRVDGAHYNNVTEIMTPDEAHRARMIMWGRYQLEPDFPQRYSVDFYAVELVPPKGVDADTLCAQFGLEPGAPLWRELKPPKLHSDVVYCDDDMRINFGSMGGVYVLNRLNTPGKSVTFA